MGNDRLARVSPELRALVGELAAAAAARGLPVDPLIEKAIEGSAKGVAAARVALALRAVFAQLDTSAAGLRAGGRTNPDTSVVAAGGFAVTAGLRGSDIAELARARAADSALIVGLRIAGTLAALGVPAPETVELVSATLQAGSPTIDLLSLPGRVQREVARGATAAQAAAGLARAAAAQGQGQGRRGPPDRGRPTAPPGQSRRP
jgi:hypothetical protein